MQPWGSSEHNQLKSASDCRDMWSFLPRRLHQIDPSFRPSAGFYSFNGTGCEPEAFILQHFSFLREQVLGFGRNCPTQKPSKFSAAFFFFPCSVLATKRETHPHTHTTGGCEKFFWNCQLEAGTLLIDRPQVYITFWWQRTAREARWCIGRTMRWVRNMWTRQKRNPERQLAALEVLGCTRSSCYVISCDVR